MGSSDHEFYKLFKSAPRLLNVFVEMNPQQTYTFEAVTFKEISRSCDGMLQSDDPDEAIVILEFQMQREASVYTRIVTEMAMCKSQNPDRTVRGLIVFLNPETDPGCANWRPIADTCPDLLKVLYLNEIYEDLKHTQPDSPLQAVFAPFVETDVTLIRQNARKWSQQLDQLPYDEAQRETFFKIFMSWLADSMPDITEKELRKMTALVRDITHTRFYKDVTEKRWREGRLKGRQEGRLKQLREMLDEGAISQEYFDKKMSDLKAQGLI